MRHLATALLVLTSSLAACTEPDVESADEQDSDEPADNPQPQPQPEPQPEPQPQPQQPAEPPPPPPPPCTPVVTQLLVNSALDMSPQGKAWQQKLIHPDYLVITAQDGIGEHSPPYKAWLGGFVAPQTGAVVSDSLAQQITIPPMTTHLVVTGVYHVFTTEQPTTVAYDTATLSVTEVGVQQGAVPIKALAISNLTKTTGWTSFGHAFTQDLSGKTVQVSIASSNDSVGATSFFLDSLAITATHGCPPPTQ